jgi:uncharacterized protein
MFIDIHVHTTPQRGQPFPGAGEGLARPDELISMYDEAAIDKGILQPLSNPESLHVIQSNEEILQVCQTHPERFIPFCNVDPRQSGNSPNADLGYMLAYYRDLGCRGIGEVCANLYFDDPRVINLFDHAEAQGLPLTFHIAPQEGNAYGLIDGLGLARFEEQVHRHPNLIWLCHSPAWWSHISGDVNDENWNTYVPGPVKEGGRIIDLMRHYPTVMGDLSGGSGYNAVQRDPDFGYWFLNEFQDQLFFGTDVCCPSHRNTVLVNLRNFLNDGLQKGAISPQAYEKITHKNAIRLLGL